MRVFDRRARLCPWAATLILSPEPRRIRRNKNANRNLRRPSPIQLTINSAVSADSYTNVRGRSTARFSNRM
jgi:hypothetical protein